MQENYPTFAKRTIPDTEAALLYLKANRITQGQYTEDTEHAIEDYEAIAKRLDDNGYPHPNDIVWVMGVPCLHWTDPNFKYHEWFENYNEDGDPAGD